MCKTFKVSRSGFYEWSNRKPSKRSIENQVIKEEIHKLYKASHGRYGSPKLVIELNGIGIKVSRPRVARIMQKEGIKSIVKGKYKVCTTDSNHGYQVSANLLNRNFNTDAPAKAWVSDLTYIRTEKGWLYLTIIMDLYDRKVIGWAMSKEMTAGQTIVPAWQMAIKNRPITSKLIFHSDRGIQYACKEFRSILNKSNVNQSMSRKGNCWDNAVAESFFKIIKSEMIRFEKFQNAEDAKVKIFEFIEIWYNRIRTHSALGYLSPEEFWKSNVKIAA